MSEPTQTPITDALARSMREWITPDGPRVCMIEDAVKLVLHARDLERVAKRLAEAGETLASRFQNTFGRKSQSAGTITFGELDALRAALAEFAKMMLKEK